MLSSYFIKVYFNTIPDIVIKLTVAHEPDLCNPAVLVGFLFVSLLRKTL